MEDHTDYCKDVIIENENMFMLNSSKEEDCLLIDLVKSYPHLYDKENKDFKETLKKNDFWKEIAQVLNATVSDCQNKWVRLRERFSREKKLREMETRSGSRATTRQPFHLYDQMKFLFKFVKSRKSMTNLLRSTKRPLIDDSIEKFESSNISRQSNTSDINKPKTTATITSLPSTSFQHSMLRLSPERYEAGYMTESNISFSPPHSPDISNNEREIRSPLESDALRNRKRPSTDVQLRLTGTSLSKQLGSSLPVSIGSSSSSDLPIRFKNKDVNLQTK